MDGCVGGWVGQWEGSGQITKNLINLDLIEIIQFCVDVWVVGSVSGSMGEVRSGPITKNLINLDLIQIIQFCLKIYNL